MTDTPMVDNPVSHLETMPSGIPKEKVISNYIEVIGDGRGTTRMAAELFILRHACLKEKVDANQTTWDRLRENSKMDALIIDAKKDEEFEDHCAEHCANYCNEFAGNIQELANLMVKNHKDDIKVGTEVKAHHWTSLADLIRKDEDFSEVYKEAEKYLESRP